MISGLFSDIYSFLFGALAPADVLRQLAVIVLCMGLGWGMSRGLRKMFTLSDDSSDVLRLGVKSFVRVLSPLLILILLALSRMLLVKMHHPVTLWQVMMPLMIAQVAMRFVVLLCCAVSSCH